MVESGGVVWFMVYGSSYSIFHHLAIRYLGRPAPPMVPGRSGNVGAPTQNRLLFYFLVESCEVRSRV
jgi:hypothetical protein